MAGCVCAIGCFYISVITVEGTDFDYPAPSRALLEVLPDLLDRLLEAEDSGYL